MKLARTRGTLFPRRIEGDAAPLPWAEESCEPPEQVWPPEMSLEAGSRKATPTVSAGLRILIVEDDVPLANLLRRRLATDGYDIDVAHDGDVACQMLGSCNYDLLTLDLNLPKLDGMAVLKQVRPSHPSLAVLVLTGRNRVEDRVLSLDGGADDCLIKPFSLSEFSARVRALLRRTFNASEDVLQVGDLVLDAPGFRVERAGQRIDLTVKEFALLEYLMRNAGRPLLRSVIAEKVWGLKYDPSSNLVDVYVKYVRDKVDVGFTSKMIRTIRGLGYMLSDE